MAIILSILMRKNKWNLEVISKKKNLEVELSNEIKNIYILSIN